MFHIFNIYISLIVQPLSSQRLSCLISLISRMLIFWALGLKGGKIVQAGGDQGRVKGDRGRSSGVKGGHVGSLGIKALSHYRVMKWKYQFYRYLTD